MPVIPYRRLGTAELVESRPTRDQLDAARLPVIIVLDNVRSAFNVGLIFRLADNVNAAGLWLGGITPYPGLSEHATNHIERTAVGGSLDVVPWEHSADITPAVADRRRHGWSVVAVEQAEGAEDVRWFGFRLPTVLIFGHERRGVQDELLALADSIVQVPVRGVTNSLNVAVCAGVVLYALLAGREKLHQLSIADANAPVIPLSNERPPP